MVQTRSRAQSRPNSRRSKSIPNPSSSKSTPNTEQFTQEKVQIDSIDNQIVQHNDVLATPNHSLPKSVYTQDDQEEEEEGLGESDKLQLAGIIDSISNDVAPTNLPIMNWTMDSGVVNEQDLEEESSDSDEEDATDDNIKVEKELEMELEQESIEYDSEEEGLNEEMKVIHFNDKGQPIGEGVGPFANKVGKITRKHIPVSYAKWREVPEKTIDAVWKRITDKYIIPVAYKHNIVAKIRASWKKYKSMLRAKHYDSYCTDEERKRNCPKNVKQDDWIKFVDNQSTPAAQAQRLRGKKARQAVKTPHFSGRYGAARVADAMKKKNPSGTISRTEVYVALHSRADGSCTEEVEKIKAIAMENPSSINLDVDHDPVAQVRGPEQNGKAIRGLGCGVSKASLRYSAPAIHHLQQERGLRIAAEKKLVEVGVNVDSPNSAEACSLGQIQNTPILRKRKSISEPRNSSDEATPSGKRIREFEDDNSDMDYEDEEDGGGVSSEEESETEFMESVADDIPSGSNIEKRVIQFNEKGQPVGEGSTSFAVELGKIARKHCPVSYGRWKAVPGPTRDTLWKLAGDKYIIPDIYKVKVLKIMYLAWKKYKSQLRTKCYDAHSTDEERKRNRPKDVKQVIWNKFVDNESSPAAQALRQLGRIARQSMKTPHVSGRTGAARTAEALKKKNPSGTVTRTDVYVAIHSRPDGSCPTPELTEKLEKIKAIAKEKPDSVNLDIDHDPVAQVLGRARSGPVRGLGFGVSRLSVIHSAPVMLRLEEERRLRIAAEEKISGLTKKSIHHDPAPKEVRTSHPSAPKKDWTHPSAPKEDRRSHSSAPVDDRLFHPSDPEEDRRSYPSAPVEARRSHLCAKPKIVIPPMKKRKFYAPLDFVLPEADEISGSNRREEVDLADDEDRGLCGFEDVRRKQNVSAEEELAILKQQVKSQKEQIGELQQEREVITELRKQILSQGLVIADMKELFARLTS